ncbi:MAG: hypothetical protein LRY73_00155 [Bacillus sp. (in: Bacteria)]|nr:hypothetical protein [Bacillus sp. (in: firmicutes)]
MKHIKQIFFTIVVAIFSIISIYVYDMEQAGVGAEENLTESLYERYDRSLREAYDITGMTAEEAFTVGMSEGKMQKTLVYMLNSVVDAEWKWIVYEIT